MESDADVDFSRYSFALRRSRKLIAVAALLGALLGAAVAGTAPLQVTLQLRPVQSSAVLKNAGLEVSDLDLDEIAGVVAARLGSESFELQLVDEFGSALGIVVIPPALGQTATTVTVSGGSSEIIDDVALRITEEAQAVYAAEVSKESRAVESDVKGQIETATERLAETLAVIDQARSDQDFLVEGLLVEAERWKREIDTLSAQAAAIVLVDVSAGDDLRRFGDDQAERPRSPITLAIGGAVAGALAAVFVVLGRASLDRSIRTRRDLERLGLTDMVAAISRDATPAEIGLAAASCNAVAERRGLESIQVVSVSGPAATTLVEQVSTACAMIELVARPPLSVSVDETVAALENSVTSISVQWGKDTASSVVLAANQLAAAGAGEIIVLLYDIPVRELQHVEN